MRSQDTYDYIEYKLIPVQGLTDLTLQCSQIHNSKCFIFINCGGMIDLSQILSQPIINGNNNNGNNNNGALQGSGLNDLWVFIMDKHRPLNLDNLFSGLDGDGNMVGVDDGVQVVVFDDGDVDDLDEERAAYFALFDDDDDSEVSDNDDNDGGEEKETEDVHNDDKGDLEGGRNGAVSDDEDAENEDDQNAPGEEVRDSDDDEEMQIKVNRKRRRSLSPEKSLLKKNRKLCERLLREYYVLNYNGTPASQMAYQLTNQLSKESNSSLWTSIVGMTSQYLGGLIDDEQYLLQVELLNDDVKRFNNTPTLDDNYTQIAARDPDDNSIYFHPQELRLMLFRHWSLYESMFHSDYVASKLRIWREQGRQRLRNFFAKMGFSIQQCQQKYYDCDLDLRKVLEGRLEDVGVRYGLDKLKFPSFVRCFGFKAIAGAADVCYATAALAELSKPLMDSLKFDYAGSDGFYLAFDSLENVDLMMKGIDVAQLSQKAVVRMGIQIIEERLVKTLKNFRLIVLKDSPELYLFTNPLTLRKLAQFMGEAMTQTGRSYMPSVIAALDKDTNLYLTIGLSEGKNHFGDAFKRCADATRANLKQDRFDCSIVEIEKDDIGKFMEHLQIFL